MVTVRSIDVNFVKIRAHSGNIFNDEADILAKEGARSGRFLTANRILPDIPNANLIWTIPKSDPLVLDQNARKSIKSIQLNQHFSDLLSHPSFNHF